MRRLHPKCCSYSLDLCSDNYYMFTYSRIQAPYLFILSRNICIHRLVQEIRLVFREVTGSVTMRKKFIWYLYFCIITEIELFNCGARNASLSSTMRAHLSGPFRLQCYASQVSLDCCDAVCCLNFCQCVTISRMPNINFSWISTVFSMDLPTFSL